MGNAISPCCHPNSESSVKLVFWEGTTMIASDKHVAGELMFQFPDTIICHADSFFIGHPIPMLSIDDELVVGETYFVLPIDRITCEVLSATSLAALSSAPKHSPVRFDECPLQYVKSANGQTLIKVMPEFISRIIMGGGSREERCGTGKSSLCTTPELQKHYNQLVASKGQSWSPKLETISECKDGLSPFKRFGLDWRSTKQ